jgi:hypothetical protein
MSISFARERCRDWSFRVLGGEWHPLCAVRLGVGPPDRLGSLSALFYEPLYLGPWW